MGRIRRRRGRELNRNPTDEAEEEEDEPFPLPSVNVCRPAVLQVQRGTGVNTTQGLSSKSHTVWGTDVLADRSPWAQRWHPLAKKESSSQQRQDVHRGGVCFPCPAVYKPSSTSSPPSLCTAVTTAQHRPTVGSSHSAHGASARCPSGVQCPKCDPSNSPSLLSFPLSPARCVRAWAPVLPSPRACPTFSDLIWSPGSCCG
ncbi:unnamed protein product [Gadus morhua 'NCC']